MNVTDRKVLRLAAAIIAEDARCLEQSHTIRGVWPTSEDKVKKYHESLVWTAKELLAIERRHK